MENIKQARSKFLRNIYQTHTGNKEVTELSDFIDKSKFVYKDEYVEYLEKNLFSFIKTECNINFIESIISDIDIIKIKALNKSKEFKKQQLLTASISLSAMATAYGEVVEIIKNKIK